MANRTQPRMQSAMLTQAVGANVRWRIHQLLELPEARARVEKGKVKCFHAMAGLDKLFPNGGLFGTGFKMWGFNGTARVLIEYTERSRVRELLLEPVDVKKDRYGFVYAPTRNGSVPYNPTRNASAYRM
jgi:hypothetical protein